MTLTRGAREVRRLAILLVEDDPSTASMLTDRFGARGHCIWRAATAAEGEALVDEVRPDVIIIDLALPDRNGLALCATLKEKQAAPIIICSGTKRKDDPFLALKLGADDFIAKPFSFDELEARVEVALRRAAQAPAAESSPRRGVLRVGSLVIDQAGHRVAIGNQAVHLTPTEFRLLSALADRPNEVVSREELAERIWGHHDAGIGLSIEVHLRRLRAKLNAGPVPAPPIETVRGIGYRLVRESRSAIPVARAGL